MFRGKGDAWLFKNGPASDRRHDSPTVGNGIFTWTSLPAR